MIAAVALHVVKLVCNRQRRQHRNFLRVHGLRHVGDVVHLFVHVLRELLHILHIQFPLDGIHLPENLHFHRPAHRVSARVYRHNTTSAPRKSPPSTSASCAKSHLHYSRRSVPCELQPVCIPSPRHTNPSARARSAPWPASLVARNPLPRCNTPSGSCHSIARRPNALPRQSPPGLATAAGRCSLPLRFLRFFGAPNGISRRKAWS